MTTLPLTPWLIDMVHHNPGEAPFDTCFTDPLEIKARGYTSQCFKHINTVMELPDAGGNPPSAEEREWLDAFTAERVKEIKAAKAAGLLVIYHIDLFVLPKRIVEARKHELCDDDGKLSLNKPALLELHRHLFDEMFTRFPEIDGLIPRVGETYLFDTPFHVGNGAVRYQGDEIRPEEIDGFISLLTFLREEICEKHNRWLIHRTWDTMPERFHGGKDFYLQVTDAIPLHEKLLFSVKHTKADFHRYCKWNPCLGQGKHPQVVEVQCQREYEGKGAYPNYSTYGVLEGFPEVNPGKGLRSFVSDPLYKGVYAWSRGGGWYGPRITRTNEFWCDANVCVLAGFVKDPRRSESDLFNEFCSSKGINPADAAIVHEIALGSLEGVRMGKCCEAFDTRPDVEHYYPTNQWMRDDVLGGWKHLEPVFDYLVANGYEADALSEKERSVAVWADLEKRANSLTMSDLPELREVIVASCAYGHRLFSFISCAWHALVLDYCRRQGKSVSETKIQAQKQAAKTAWTHYQALPVDHPSAATLYKGHSWHWPQDPAPEGVLAALESIA